MSLFFPLRRHVIAIFLAAALLGAVGCASLQSGFKPAPPSYALADTAQTPLGRAWAEQIAGHGGDSGFYLLNSGMDAFLARALLAKAAQRSLDLQYYIAFKGETTTLLFNQIIQAADRGVRVRLLFDDHNTGGSELSLRRLDGHPNIEVRLFNPFRQRRLTRLTRPWGWLSDFSRLNHRMHNKMFVADNQAAVFGGRNLADEYFEASQGANFKDLDLFAVGPVVQALSRSFDEYWNSPWAVPVGRFWPVPPDQEDVEKARRRLAERVREYANSEYVARLKTADLLKRLERRDIPLVWAPAKLAYDSPAKAGESAGKAKQVHVGPQLRPYAEQTRTEMVLISPYFIPSDNAVEFLTGKSREGVRVRILTNSLSATDEPLVYAGYARQRRTLLAGGVELYEMKGESAASSATRASKWFGLSSPASLHAKTFIFDRQRVFIGSFNLDPRSLNLNTELGVVVESPELARQVNDVFEEAIRPENSYHPVLEGAGEGSAGGKASKGEAGEKSAAAKAEGKVVWLTEEHGREVRYKKEPGAGFSLRVANTLLKLLPIEGLL